MFIVRTAAGAEELSLFTQRSHPRLRRLEQVLSMLDELGLGERSRAGAFVDIGAAPALRPSPRSPGTVSRVP